MRITVHLQSHVANALDPADRSVLRPVRFRTRPSALGQNIRTSDKQIDAPRLPGAHVRHYECEPIGVPINSTKPLKFRGRHGRLRPNRRTASRDGAMRTEAL